MPPASCTSNIVLWVATGDVNGDGKADLVAALQGSSNAGCQTNAVAVLEGLGTGKFQKAAYYPTGSTTQKQTVYLVDVNGDGMPDVALVNTGGFNPDFISVMFNSTQPVSISPLNVNYGSVTVGAKKAETVILTNDQSTSLAISSITLSGTDPGDFSAKSTCGTSRKAGVRRDLRGNQLLEPRPVANN